MAWVRKVNRHCVYIQQETVDGNTTYVKRRPAIITALGAGELVNIRVGHSGETFTNVDRKFNPLDNTVGVYVSF